MKPYVVVNVAASIDGRITDWRKKQIRISCEEDMKRVDKLRAECDGILVGIGTVLSDNPSLKVKSLELRRERVKFRKDENPIRIVVDSKARTPLNSKIVDGTAKTIIATTSFASKEKIKALSALPNVKVVVFKNSKNFDELNISNNMDNNTPNKMNLVNLKELLEYLYGIGIRKLMIEGGARIIRSFLREGLVDRLIVYYGGVIFGEGTSIVEGKLNPHLKFKLLNVEKVGRGFISEWSPLIV